MFPPLNFKDDCLHQLNKIMLPNLTWSKGLIAWNRIFGFNKKESDLLRYTKLAKGSEKLKSKKI